MTKLLQNAIKRAKQNCEWGYNDNEVFTSHQLAKILLENDDAIISFNCVTDYTSLYDCPYQGSLKISKGLVKGVPIITIGTHQLTDPNEKYPHNGIRKFKWIFNSDNENENDD